MKKLFFMAALTALVMAGCTKDDDNNQNNSNGNNGGNGDNSGAKLEYVYTTETSTDPDYEAMGRVLSEKWTWDGNQVKSIAYYDEGDLSLIETFTYDADGKIASSSFMGMATAHYTYNSSNQLTNISLSYDGTEMGLTFTYEGGKVKTITSTDTYQTDEKGLLAKATRGVVPAMITNIIQRYGDRKSGRKDIETYTTQMTLTWSGSNISSITISAEGEEYGTAYCTYDNKTNPYYGVMSAYGLMNMQLGPIQLNANNLASMTTSMLGMEESVTMSYEYNGDLPVKQSYTSPEYYESSDWDEETQDYITTYDTFYTTTLNEYQYVK